MVSEVGFEPMPTYVDQNWVNSMVVVEKPNRNLCILLDPKHLNKAIKRPHYAMPTTEETLTKIN